MSQALLKEKYIKLGILQGPKESDSDYMLRAKKLSSNPKISCPDGLKALAIVEKLYGISPSWVKIDYVDHGIRFWEGGATYIEEGIPTICLPKKKRFFAPSNEEIIAHEMVHAARSAFPNSPFEEYFAYQTSKSWLYRVLGPLFPSNYSILFFLISSLFCTSSLFELNWLMLLSTISFALFFIARPLCIHILFKIFKKKMTNLEMIQSSFIDRLKNKYQLALRTLLQ